MVNFRFRAAVIRISGKANDLRVSCEGGRKLERSNRRGLKLERTVGAPEADE